MMTNAQAALIAAATWHDASKHTQTDVLQTAHEWTMYLNGRQDADGGATSAPQADDTRPDGAGWPVCSYCGRRVRWAPLTAQWIDDQGSGEHITYNGHQTAPHQP